MAVGRALLVLGLVCCIASVCAQTPAWENVDWSKGGNYLVNGSGIVYDKDAITLYYNNTAIGTIPYGDKAAGPSSDDHSDGKDTFSKDATSPSSKDMWGHDDKQKDDGSDDLLKKDKNGVYTFDFTKHHDAPAPGSPEDDDALTTIIDQLKAKTQENPLDKVIIGRKLKL